MSYIKLEDAILEIQRYGVGVQDFESYTPEQAERFVIGRLESIPAADVVPVRRGKWTCKRTQDHDGDWWCTACGKELTIYMGARNDRYKFCPYCGARMDGGGDDESAD